MAIEELMSGFSMHAVVEIGVCQVGFDQFWAKFQTKIFFCTYKVKILLSFYAAQATSMFLGGAKLLPYVLVLVSNFFFFSSVFVSSRQDILS